MLVPEEMGTARYRVRTFLTNTSPSDVQVEAAGKKTRVTAGSTVYSPWSEQVIVSWGAGSEIRVDVDADGPDDPTIGMMEPPLAIFARDILTTLGMPDRSVGAAFTFLTFVGGMVALAAVIAIAGPTMPGIFLGSSVAALIMFSGGTFLLGIPWYVFGAPLAILVMITIVFYVRRGAG